MDTNYHVEDIERITEQSLEQEVWNDVIDIKNNTVRYVKNTHADASREIINIGNNAVSQAEDIVNGYLEYSAEQKRDMVLQLAEAGIRGELNNIDADTNVIYQNTVAIAQNTEDVIENDIRNMIVEKGYQMVFTNDGNGNVTATLSGGDN